MIISELVQLASRNRPEKSGAVAVYNPVRSSRNVRVAIAGGYSRVVAAADWVIGIRRGPGIRESRDRPSPEWLMNDSDLRPFLSAQGARFRANHRPGLRLRARGS
jgi:hypothetical protein